MKKFILAAMVAVCSLTANAQFYVGGTLGYSSEKAHKNADAVSTFTIAPEVGYNLSDNLAVAVALGYTDNDGASEFNLNPYARYTFAKSGVLSFFVDGGLNFTSYEEGNSFGIGVQPGVAYAASEKISIVAKTGGLGYVKKSDELGGGSVFGINANNQLLSFGVYYNF